MPLQPGDILHDRYRVESLLGQGGMGVVYRAHDERLKVPCAVKENFDSTPAAARQFEREARILAALQHPHLPRVTDQFVIPEQGQYLVMTYVAGEDLAQVVERRDEFVPEWQVLEWIEPIADALSYLHSQSPPLIHRDVKPANIKITAEGKAVLVDFGLAKVWDPDRSTTTGAKGFSPGYAPPEQLGVGGRTDPRTDVYSLGATMYALLTLTLPADGLDRVLRQDELVPLRALRPDVSPHVAAAVEKALEVQPDDRWQSVADFWAALTGASAAEAVQPASQSTDETFVELAPPIVLPPEPTPVAPSQPAPQSIQTEVPSQPIAPFQPVVYSQPIPAAPRKSFLRWIFDGFWLLLALATVGGGIVVAGLIFWPQIDAFLRDNGITIALGQPAFSEDVGTITPFIAPSLTPAQIAVSPLPPTATSESPGGAPTHTPVGAQAEAPLSAPTPLGGGAQIAFVSERSGAPQVWLVAIDGSGAPEQLTQVADGACQPAWAPDGVRLAYISPCREKADTYPNAAVYVLDLGARETTRLTTLAGGDYDPDWSPDGARIAFTSERDGREHIYVMNADGTEQTNFSRPTAHDWQPSWSPDGSQIAFVSPRAGRREIWIMGADDGEPQTTLTRDLGVADDYVPDWSPDGRLMLFEQQRSGQVPVIFTLVVEQFAVNSSQLTFPPFPSVDPTWSPDGLWIAYEAWPDGANHDIWYMTSNGAEPTRVTTAPALDYQPAWRPSN